MILDLSLDTSGTVEGVVLRVRVPPETPTK